MQLEIGMKVRLTIPKGKKPIQGWGSAKNGDIGEVTFISKKIETDSLGRRLQIKFRHQGSWSGYECEFTPLEESNQLYLYVLKQDLLI